MLSRETGKGWSTNVRSTFGTPATVSALKVM